MMLRRLQFHLKQQLCCCYTTKAKRILLTQNQSKIKEYKPNIKNKNKNRIYAWGLQATGALGLQKDQKHAQQYHKDIVQHPTRQQFSENTDIVNVTAGYGFSVFAVDRSDHETLFGCGINTDSQLGLQKQYARPDAKSLDIVIYPTAITLPKLENETSEDMRVRCMSAGRAHLVVVTQNGTIFTLGNNAYGQCGRTIIPEEDYKQSALIHRLSEQQFCAPDDHIVDVQCGQDHTLFLSKQGRVYSCGWGADGQTGLGDYRNCAEITQVRGDISGEHIVKLAGSADCVLALNTAGEVFGWGNSEYGQLDDSEDATTQLNVPRALTLTRGLGRLKDIAAGGAFCLMLTEDGLVYSWGFGILGFGPNVQQASRPQQLPAQLFGRNDFNPDIRVEAIGCGLFHMGAINSQGDLYMWGRNNCGQLGLGHKKDQFFPFKTAINGKVHQVAYGIDHTMALCKSFLSADKVSSGKTYVNIKKTINSCFFNSFPDE